MSGQHVNPVSLCEPLAGKVNTAKPHDVTDIMCMCVPCVPFLDMVWVAVNRGGTRRFSPSPVSCSNKVHKVHGIRQSPRRVAVSTRERQSKDAHTRFTGFTEVLD